MLKRLLGSPRADAMASVRGHGGPLAAYPQLRVALFAWVPSGDPALVNLRQRIVEAALGCRPAPTALVPPLVSHDACDYVPSALLTFVGSNMKN